MDIYTKINEARIIPVIKIPSVEYAVPLARAIYESGLHQIEVTLRNECALDCIAAIKQEFPQMLVAAGTVLYPEQVYAAEKAGAELIVTPGLNETVAKVCLERNLPMLPGCVTATEIDRGLELGFSTFKFFPAESMGGLRTIRELSKPYSRIKFVPTSGIGFDNLKRYLSDPSVAAVGGSFMAPADMILAKNWNGIRQLCQRAVEIMKDACINDIKKEVKTFEDLHCDILKKSRTPKVVGFGDFIVRFSPVGYLRLKQARSFDINYTGAEANVLISLSCMNVKTEFVTRLPNNAIADSGIGELRRLEVGTSNIVRGGERIGLFYVEKGASQRPSRIVYDRKYSSIATSELEMFNWDKIFADATHFHITGITPALGGNMPEISIEAVKKAKEHGLTVSCDLNYRSNMWEPETAKACMENMLKYVDILIANEEDADKVLGIRAKNTDVTAGKLDRAGYVDVARQLNEKYGFKAVGITLRKSISASDNEWGALLYVEGKPYFSKTYPIHIVDRVGGEILL